MTVREKVAELPPAAPAFVTVQVAVTLPGASATSTDSSNPGPQVPLVVGMTLCAPTSVLTVTKNWMKPAAGHVTGIEPVFDFDVSGCEVVVDEDVVVDEVVVED